jgi:hypothetical protein
MALIGDPYIRIYDIGRLIVNMCIGFDGCGTFLVVGCEITNTEDVGKLYFALGWRSYWTASIFTPRMKLFIF